jgi:hypothetical protein
MGDDPDRFPGPLGNGGAQLDVGMSGRRKQHGECRAGASF